MSETLDDAAKERRKHYKKSLNLPRTSFAMKANLKQNEPLSIKRWQKEDLYSRIQEKRADAHLINPLLAGDLASAAADFASSVPVWDIREDFETLLRSTFRRTLAEQGDGPFDPPDLMHRALANPD